MADLKAIAPSLDVDPYTSDVLENPYPTYKTLREAGPMFWLEKYQVLGAARFEEVSNILHDWETFSSGSGVGLDDLSSGVPFRPKSLLLEVDPPVHDKTRKVMNRVLSMSAVSKRREAFETVAASMVESVVKRAEFDGVGDLAAPYVLKVFPDAVGLEVAGRENLLPWGDMVFNSFGPRNARFEASAKDAERVKGYIFDSSLRENVTEDGLAHDVFSAVDNGVITEDEGGVLVRAMLTAGLDTTLSGLAAALYAFAKHPDQWQQIREDHTRIRPAIDEVVRWGGPVQTFFRTTTREVELAGISIPKKSKVLVFMAAANRDPRKFERPEDFDALRDARGHVGFGHGIHKCVGQMIAKLEIEVMLKALAARVERLDLAGPPTFHLNNTVRAFAKIPLRVR